MLADAQIDLSKDPLVIGGHPFASRRRRFFDSDKMPCNGHPFVAELRQFGRRNCGAHLLLSGRREQVKGRLQRETQQLELIKGIFECPTGQGGELESADIGFEQHSSGVTIF